MKSCGMWNAKLNKFQPPRVVGVPEDWKAQYGEGTMLIPPAPDVDAVIRTILEGRLMTVPRLRKLLGEMHGADTSCPLVTGIHLRIVSEASEERMAEGSGNETPWWRVVTGKGELRPKFPGGVEEHARRLEAEGHSIESGRNGRPKRVLRFEDSLI